MVAWFKRDIRDYPELSSTLKPYKKHRTRILETMRIVEMAVNIFTLKDKAKKGNKEV